MATGLSAENAADEWAELARSYHIHSDRCSTFGPESLRVTVLSATDTKSSTPSEIKSSEWQSSESTLASQKRTKQPSQPDAWMTGSNRSTRSAIVRRGTDLTVLSGLTRDDSLQDMQSDVARTETPLFDGDGKITPIRNLRRAAYNQIPLESPSVSSERVETSRSPALKGKADGLTPSLRDIRGVRVHSAETFERAKITDISLMRSLAIAASAESHARSQIKSSSKSPVRTSKNSTKNGPQKHRHVRRSHSMVFLRQSHAGVPSASLPPVNTNSGAVGSPRFNITSPPNVRQTRLARSKQANNNASEQRRGIVTSNASLEEFVSVRTGEKILLDRTSERVHLHRRVGSRPSLIMPSQSIIDTVPEMSRRSSFVSAQSDTSAGSIRLPISDVKHYLKPALEGVKLALAKIEYISNVPESITKALNFLDAAAKAAWSTIEKKELETKEANGNQVLRLLGPKASKFLRKGKSRVLYRMGVADRLRKTRAVAMIENNSENQYLDKAIEAEHPQYQCEMPIPKNIFSRGILAHVRVSPLSHPAITAEAVIDTLLHKDDTAETVMKTVLKRHLSGGDFEDCRKLGLKAFGLNEWIISKSKIRFSKFIRTCVRNREPIVLSMLPLTKSSIALMSLQADRKNHHQVAEKWISNFEDDNKEKLQQIRNLQSERDGTESMKMGLERVAKSGFAGWRTIKQWPSTDCHVPFHVDIVGIDNELHKLSLPRLQTEGSQIKRPVFVSVSILFGDQKILFDEETADCTAALEWHERVRPKLPNVPCPISVLPAAARLSLVVRQRLEAESNQSIVLGYAVISLFDQGGFLKQGIYSLPLWPQYNAQSSVSATDLSDNWLFSAPTSLNDSSRCKLTIKLPQFTVPVVCSWIGPKMRSSFVRKNAEVKEQISKESRERLEEIALDGTVKPLSPSDAEMLWNHRYRLCRHAKLLPAFARCVTWYDEQMAAEARAIIEAWTPPREPSTALQLLHYAYAEGSVRKIAVEWLRARFGGGGILEDYVLQLVQCLKFELYNHSSLSKLLIDSAMLYPNTFAHKLFWNARAELDFAHPGFKERYTLLLEELLLRLPQRIPRDFTKTVDLVRELEEAAMDARRIGQVGQSDALAKRLEVVSRKFLCGNDTKGYEIKAGPGNQISQLKTSKGVQLPFDPRIRVGPLRVHKCRVLSSKMKPLWLVFENVEKGAPDINVIFKDGDDLRQDMLMLQILRILGNTWLEAGLDMRLTPYNVIATGGGNGRGVGMIQAVPNSATTSSIQVSEGGGAFGAFSPKVIEQYLTRHNPSNEKMTTARENFTRSCAGYCVATFVLGIGDRHSDNIMCAKDGKLFHIDFGHVLGNFKSKFGFRRERTPFVFTPEMAFVLEGKYLKENKASHHLTVSELDLTSQINNKSMGSYQSTSLKRSSHKRKHSFATILGARSKHGVEAYKKFLELAKDAFVVVRRNSVLLETLFVLMVSAGLPELSDRGSIQYLSDQLFLHLGDRDANYKLEKMVKNARNDNYRRLDNYLHAVAHSHKGSKSRAAKITRLATDLRQ